LAGRYPLAAKCNFRTDRSVPKELRPFLPAVKGKLKALAKKVALAFRRASVYHARDGSRSFD
jgi:hypothetical protein